jgi:integrase
VTTENLKGTKIVNISPNSGIITIENTILPKSEKRYNTHASDHRPVSFLLEDEVNILVDAAGTMRDGQRNNLMILLLFQCCLRVSECLQLTKNHRTKLNGKYVFMVIGKGEKKRLVPIPEKLSDKFGNYITEAGLGPDDRLFPFTRFRALQIVKECGKKAGLDNRRIYNHLFRHAGSIARLKRTGNIQSLKTYLGHTDHRMTERYLITLQTIESLEIEGKVEF